MNPDGLSISIVTAIGGACLLSLLVALLVLANIERVECFFHIQRRPIPRPTLPARYVVPYVQPGPLVERVDMEQRTQRRTPYQQNPSDELLPRNATPGPSNVPRTPPPAYNPAAEDYGRYLRDRFHSPTPDLPLITIPDSPESATRALDPDTRHRTTPPTHQPSPEGPESIRIFHPRPRPLPAGPIIVTDRSTIPHLCPLPDSGSDSDSSEYGGNEPVDEREDNDPLNPYGPDFEWPSLDAIDRAYLGPYCSHAWEIRRVDIENQSHHEGPENRIPIAFYLAVARGPPLPNGRPLRETAYKTYAPEPRANNEHWSMPYSPLRWQRETAPTSTAPFDERFDTFNQDQGTFGWADDNDDENYEEEYGDYRGYTSTPRRLDPLGYTRGPTYDFPRYPFPLPDSLPRQVRHHGQYHGPRTSRLYARNGDGGEGSTQPPDPEAEKRRAATEEASAKLHHIAELEKQLNDAEMEHRDLATQWGLPLRPTITGGKLPDRGRPAAPTGP
ncbi:hypothetical protein ARMSODRAFT_1022535 [Armillaria solidipes]|uniref:Uncharacterized protein n=1 Tax=Armillaria solidipes TaxID=1076256 RepID=A0A2H3BPX0_9AGAR|nr:hypothetical protein ARMSODRAFT_1022535 [Armillaria solidipes]